jgi:hypothetical protein
MCFKATPRNTKTVCEEGQEAQGGARALMQNLMMHYVAVHCSAICTAFDDACSLFKLFALQVETIGQQCDSVKWTLERHLQQLKLKMVVPGRQFVLGLDSIVGALCSFVCFSCNAGSICCISSLSGLLTSRYTL